MTGMHVTDWFQWVCGCNNYTWVGVPHPGPRGISGLLGVNAPCLDKTWSNGKLRHSLCTGKPLVRRALPLQDNAESLHQWWGSFENVDMYYDVLILCCMPEKTSCTYEYQKPTETGTRRRLKIRENNRVLRVFDINVMQCPMRQSRSWCTLRKGTSAWKDS